MTEILLLKETLKKIYGKNDMFLRPLGKFILALVVLCIVNAGTGYMKSLSGFFIALIISIICCVMPGGFTVLSVTLVLTAHLYALSLELAVVALIVFLIMYLFYFRFSSKGSIWLVITLICFTWKIPYVVPIAVGLLSGLYSIVPVIFGAIIYYFIDFSKRYAVVLAGTAAEERDIFDNFLDVINGLMNKEIILVAISFALTIAIVYVIRRLSINYAWIYAVVAGALTDFVMILVGNVIFRTNLSFFGNLIGLILAIVVGLILNLFFFGVDYSRTERVQYEDDNYYYYVKAVPKYSVSKSEVRVKKIDTQRKHRPSSSDDDFDELDRIDIDF